MALSYKACNANVLAFVPVGNVTHTVHENSCHNHGILVPQSGHCVCDLPFTGTNCTEQRRFQERPRGKAPHVCMVVDGYGLLDSSSGIATAYASLSEFLAQQGLQITVVHTSGQNREDFEAAVAHYHTKNITLVR